MRLAYILMRAGIALGIIGAILAIYCMWAIERRKQMPTGYGKNDAAEETEVTPKEVSRAWHAARDDAQRDDRLPEREESKKDD